MAFLFPWGVFRCLNTLLSGLNSMHSFQHTCDRTIHYYTVHTHRPADLFPFTRTHYSHLESWLCFCIFTSSEVPWPVRITSNDVANWLSYFTARCLDKDGVDSGESGCWHTVMSVSFRMGRWRTHLKCGPRAEHRCNLLLSFWKASVCFTASKQNIYQLTLQWAWDMHFTKSWPETVAPSRVALQSLKIQQAASFNKFSTLFTVDATDFQIL